MRPWLQMLMYSGLAVVKVDVRCEVGGVWRGSAVGDARQLWRLVAAA